MFGRKVPDKVMPPGSGSANAGPPRQEAKPAAPRSMTPVRNEAAPRRSNSSAVGTVLGEDTVFEGGKIVSRGTLRIDGVVEGEILAEDSVVVGPTGTVKANITARNVAISGKVFGNIIAHERLELQPTSEVHGDIQTATGALIIEGGAKLEGRCIMGEIRPAARPAGQPPRPNPVEDSSASGPVSS